MRAHQYSLGSLMRTNALIHARRPALIEEDRQISHGELERRTNRLARVLLSHGVTKGDRVALLLNDGNQFIELMIAAGKIGAIAILLNWRLSPGELGWILNNGAAKAIYRAERFASLLAEASVCQEYVIADNPAGLIRYESWASEGPDAPLALAIGPEDPLLMMFTSGTTGRPKGCLHSHGSTLAHATLFARRRGLVHSDCNLSTNPLFHVAGLGHVISVLAAGGASVFIPRDSDPLAPVELALRHGCTISTTNTPLMSARALVDEQTWSRLPFRTLTTGAGMTDPRAFAFAGDIWNALVCGGWGQTETWGFATMIDYPDMIEHPSSIGWTISPIEAVVLDDTGLPHSDPDAEGELGIRGPNVMLGYWANPEATAAALGTGWLRTGDSVTRDSLGLFHMRGRIKELIKSGGENVYPAEVEAVLRELPGIADVAVAGVVDKKWGEAVKAFIVLHPGAVVSAEAVTAACRARIAGYKRPRYLEFVDAIPRDHIGKIRRFELSARAVTENQVVV